LVPAEGNLRGRRKLLLSLGMLEAKPHVSKRKINTINVHLWNWGWSIMIIYIHTCSFDRWCLFSHYIYIKLKAIIGDDYFRWLWSGHWRTIGMGFVLQQGNESQQDILRWLLQVHLSLHSRSFVSRQGCAASLLVYIF
jgi:hypothetical protein